MKTKSLVLALCGLGLVAGCSNYYQVRDPQSGNVYYTRLVRDHVGGAVSFEDSLSGKDVTLQQSEVKRIDGDVYDARTAHIDRDTDVVDVRPAAARTAPEPDRQVEIRRYHDPDKSVDVDVVPEGKDVHINIDH